MKIESYSNYTTLQEAKLYGFTIKQLLNSTLKFKGKTLIYFDTETLGLKPHVDYIQLTQVAAIAYDGSTMKELDSFNTKAKLGDPAKHLLKPDSDERKGWEERQKARGKSKGLSNPDELLKMTRYGDEGVDFIEEKKSIEDFISFISKFKDPILIAHNAPFDMKFMHVRAKLFDLKFPKAEVLDTLKLSRLYFVPLLQAAENSKELESILTALSNKLKTGERGNKVSSTLGNLGKALGVSVDSWHDAKADVEMLMQIVERMKEFFTQYIDIDISKEHQHAAKLDALSKKPWWWSKKKKYRI